MKKIILLAAIALSALLTGCGTIETGNVGVRTQFGKIEPNWVGEGLYTALLSHVDEYTAKETFIQLNNLTPKAKDKLLLKELDVTVYYETSPARIPQFVSTHAGMSAKMPGEHFIRPAYFLIENVAKGVVSDQVSNFDSLTLHQNRTELETAIKLSLQKELDKEKSDVAGMFQVKRVMVTTLLTDPSVEESIRKNIAMNNEIDTAKKEVQKKLQEAEAMQKTAAALTPALLQHEYIQAVGECAKRQGCTLIVGSGNSVPLVNLPK